MPTERTDSARSKITKVLYNLSSRKSTKYAVYALAVILFLALILLPPILGIATKWNSIQQFLEQPNYVSRALTAVQNSFTIALLVSAMDLVVGIPMAWLIARRKSRWVKVLDTLSDIPFIVPTAVLGYSLLLFWNKPEGISGLFGGSLISPGWLLIILLHFAFSLPVVVRVIVGATLDYKREFENASRTLGAPPLTASRTVTFSIIRPSLIAAFILAFARSISETGATFIVAGSFENGPVFIQNMKNDFAAGTVSQAIYEGSTVFASFFLIVVAVTIFLVIRILGPRLKLPVKRVYPSFERKLSYSKAAGSRDIVTLVIFFAIVLVPSLFVARPAFQAIFSDTLPKSLSGTGIWADFWQSLVLSYLLGAIVTVVNVLIGLPMAIIIARRKFGKLVATILDVFVNIPLVVPSIALGVSLGIFWKTSFSFIPEMLLLIFAHVAITYPYFVRSMSAAVERISFDLEEASRTLGAKPLGVFRTIILPLTKYSILSGAIMVFTRSVSETGATVAVVTTLKTAPVVLVNWVTHPTQFTPLETGLGSGYLVLFSFIILLALRLIVKEKGRY
ncbi:MAG TPA: ABC transporter permease subunit [Candidatus Bathyarchaeia archaeon]|nr:ABC transporter permease subunit [Candidatus Bathyarchaeia archaeon]